MRFLSVLAIATVLVRPCVSHAEDIRLLGAVASKESVAEVIPGFQKSQGHVVSATWASTVNIKARLAAGEIYDVVILPSPEIEALIGQGKLATGSRVDLMRSGIGVGVRAAAPRPDISSKEALKATLLAAKTIGYSTGASGTYLERLLGEMGIADEVRPKLKLAPPSGSVGGLIASGDAELGFQQVSELIHYPGVDYIGPLPAAVQNVTVFSAATPREALHPQAGKVLITYMAGPAGEEVIRRHGMEPSEPR